MAERDTWGPAATNSWTLRYWAPKQCNDLLCGNTNAYRGADALRGDAVHRDRDQAYLSFWLIPGDGMGGNYVFDASSLAVDDGLSLDVLKPTNIDEADPGRWIKTG